jgi:predicted dehydrogenase
MSDERILRIGIIGAGRVSQAHAKGLEKLKNVVVVAVADPRADAAMALADRFGANVESDHRFLLMRPDIDAVVILVPHDLHHPIALAALQMGKHVFMDKPLALTSAQGQELVAALANRLCHEQC